MLIVIGFAFVRSSEILTFIESPKPYFGYAFGDLRICKALAVFKGAKPDRNNAVRNVNACKTRAVKEDCPPNVIKRKLKLI